MNFYILLLLAIGLSVDSLAISISAGCQKGAISLKAIRYAIIMGLMHFLFLWLGWIVGGESQKYISRFDHWIAFAILTLIGVRMITQSFRYNGQPKRVRNDVMTLWGSVVVAMVASIDAFLAGGALSLEAVNFAGVVPSFLRTTLGSIGVTQAHIIAFSFVGLVVVIVSLVGLVVGKGIGRILGKWAGVLGGCMLTLLGVWILLSHLGVL